MKILNTIIKALLTKKVLGPIITIIIARIIVLIFNKAISKILVKGKNKFEIKRRKTIIELFQSIFKYLVYIIAILIILDIFGIDTKSLIASLGVVGVVLGLALQDTVKDFIGGICLILENYFQVGDIVTYKDFTGEVIELGLRTTKIKKASGEVLIVANRNIDEIINSSQKTAHLLLDIPTAYEENIATVEKTLKEVIKKAIKDKIILEDSSYLGVNNLASHNVDYLIDIHCDQNNRYAIRREILGRIKTAYDDNNLKIPYNQIEVHHGQDL